MNLTSIGLLLLTAITLSTCNGVNKNDEQSNRNASASESASDSNNTTVDAAATDATPDPSATDTSVDDNGCPNAARSLSSFALSGADYIIAADGNVLLKEPAGCTIIEKYFDPNFFELAYVESGGTYAIRSDEGSVPIQTVHSDDFQGYSNFVDVFPTGISDIVDHYFTAFTLLSPEARTVGAYVTLRKCLLKGTCDFLDNRIAIAPGPLSSSNTTLRFETIGPAADMVTSKASIQSLLAFFRDGDDLWLKARFYIESGMPYSLVDLENEHFLHSPGPRVVISNGKLALENKFGAKLFYRPSGDVPTVPLATWWTLTLHIAFDDGPDGHVEIYQDDTLILSADGPTLPTHNSVQNSVELGISASSEATVLYMDDFAISTESLR